MERVPQLIRAELRELEIPVHPRGTDYKGRALAAFKGELRPENGYGFLVEKPYAGKHWRLRFYNDELMRRFLSLSEHAQRALLDAIEKVFSEVTLQEVLQLEVDWTPTKKRHIEIHRNGDYWAVTLL